jgi:folate-dependent phosphoribosylglycinamide formyltransferase PurN
MSVSQAEINRCRDAIYLHAIYLHGAMRAVRGRFCRGYHWFLINIHPSHTLIFPTCREHSTLQILQQQEASTNV